MKRWAQAGLLATPISWGCAPSICRREALLRHPWPQQYDFTLPQSFMNDPSGMVPYRPHSAAFTRSCSRTWFFRYIAVVDFVEVAALSAAEALQYLCRSER